MRLKGLKEYKGQVMTNDATKIGDGSQGDQHVRFDTDVSQMKIPSRAQTPQPTYTPHSSSAETQTLTSWLQ